MEGKLPASGLDAACGNAAAEAKRQADRVISYHTAEITSVTILDVGWEIEDCRVAEEASEDRLTVITREYWTYEAELNCASGVVHTSLRSERYLAGTYYLIRGLIRGTEGWIIDDWELGKKVAITYWSCP